VNVANMTDWINTPTAASCFGCHTSMQALAHMELNGGQLSVPDGSFWTNRSDLVLNFEACSVCHGPGRSADIEVVHNR